MNIFDRKELKLKQNIANFATDIRKAPTYNPINFAIEMDINVEILKGLDYWSIPVEPILEYIGPGKIKSAKLELESMTVLSVALGETKTRQARLRYVGEYEEKPRREAIYIGTSQTTNWEEFLRPQVLTSASVYTDESVRGARGTRGTRGIRGLEWRFEDHTYGLGLNDEE